VQELIAFRLCCQDSLELNRHAVQLCESIEHMVNGERMCHDAYLVFAIRRVPNNPEVDGLCALVHALSIAAGAMRQGHPDRTSIGAPGHQLTIEALI
jgi:hypothetical protein